MFVVSLELLSSIFAAILVSTLSGSSGIDEITCEGYESCAYQPMLNASGGSLGSIECDGSYSCFGVNHMISKTSITCSALYSCSNIELIETMSGGVIWCPGEKACFNSTINANGGGKIICDGSESCAESTFTVNNSVEISFSGAFSAQNSMILLTNNKASVLDITFESSFAGNGATVVCPFNATCSIDCYGNACNNMLLQCFSVDGTVRIDYKNDDSNSQENTCEFDISCGNGDDNNADYSDICSSGFDFDTMTSNFDNYNDYNFMSDIIDKIELLSYDLLIPDLSNVTMTTFENSQNPCPVTNNNGTSGDNSDNDNNNNMAIICDEFGDCSNSNNTGLDTTENNMTGAVCCLGMSTCYQTEYIKSNIDYDSSSNSSTTTASIRCDGGYSCQWILDYIYASNGGDIYFSGYSSGITDELENSGHYGLIEGSSTVDHNSNVYCLASTTCNSQIIENINNIYCNGENSCIDGSQITNSNNVYAYGTSSAADIEIENIQKNVYCLGNKACRSSKISNVKGNIVITNSGAPDVNITNVKGNVYALGNDVATGIVIKHVNDTVYGFGENVLKQATISNVHNVVVNGSSALISSQLTNVENIFASGSGALTNVLITSSDGVSRNDMNVIINTDDAANIQIICHTNDTCNIYCQTENAYEALVMQCYGTCTIVQASDNSGSGSGGSSGSTLSSGVIVIIVLVAVCVIGGIVLFVLFKRANAKPEIGNKNKDQFVKLDDQ